MASQGPESDGTARAAGSMSMLSSALSSSSRDSDMASKMQNALSLSIKVLEEITDNFSDERKIGQGAFGEVYRAELENGEEIAVKKLYNNMPAVDDDQFQCEFENLMRLEHHNIVRLVGYCYETQHQPMQYKGETIFAERIYRALCFEYMQNGSLDRHITCESDGLDWHTRYNIIKGTWEGLKYLHEGFNEPIYHLDIKPDNILLDKNMVPKLADFGLSKLFGDNQTMITESPIGTIGYLPMEFLHGNTVSDKLDIFSLGVVMIKIIAGHEGYSRSVEMPRKEFLDLVHENWRYRMLKTYEASGPLEAYCEQVKVCIEIALSCMEIDKNKRPNISNIIHRLNDTEYVIDKALSSTAGMHSVINRDLVKIAVLTRSEAVLCEERCDDYPIMVRVTAPSRRHAEEIPRTGVDLVLVLDLSNDHIRYIKNCIIVVIKKLGPDDRLSIVSGDGQCTMKLTFMSDKGRDVTMLLVNKLAPLKDFKVLGSLRDASEILEGREMEEGESRLGFIMVMWRKGSNDEAILKQQIRSQFPVHILIVGNSEHYFSPEIGKYIADQTSGTCSFIEEGSIDEIEEALELFIGGITKVAATSIRITLIAHEGIAISSIESGRCGSRVDSEERSGEIDINDIYTGETKNFIVKLKLAEGDMGKLVTVRGKYGSINASTQWQLLSDTDVFVLRPRSGGCSRRKLAMHPEVAAELVRVQMVKGVSAGLEALGRSIPYQMDKLWEEIRSSVAGECATKKTFAGLVKDMAEIHKRGGRKVPYVLAWLSCHEWQRATTKGSCSDSGAFMI